MMLVLLVFLLFVLFTEKELGKLREGIHSFLRKNPHVKSFRLGTYGEGEMGVTIVEVVT